MLTFKEFQESDGIDYFIVEISSDALSAEILINEGRWVDAGKNGYMYRVDAENPAINLQRHVHIAKTKHTSSKNMQASWNQDGSKHDKKTFNSKIGSQNLVQAIARDTLNLSDTLELEEASRSAQLLTQIDESNSGLKVTPVLFRAVGV